MTRFVKITAAALTATAGLGLAVPAMAEGYSVRDFGEVVDRPTCMARAKEALDTYMTRNGGGDVIPTEWVTYAWDFRPGDNDIVLMCPVVSGGVINAFFVVHGMTTEQERNQVADGVEALWNTTVGGGGGGSGGKGGKGGKK